MKKLIALLLVLSVILFACAKETKVTQTTSTGGVQTGVISEETRTPGQPAATATPDIESLTNAGNNCLKENVKVCLPVNYVLANTGDTVGFAFGVQNMLPQAKKISLKVTFVKTQQTLGELAIEPDKDYMNRWLSVNDINPYYDVQPNQKLSKPILVKIEDMIADGKSTVSGAYIFEVQAQTYDNGFYENYGGPQQFTVRVK